MRAEVDETEEEAQTEEAQEPETQEKEAEGDALGFHHAVLYTVTVCSRAGRLLALYNGYTRHPEQRKQEHEARGPRASGLVRCFADPQYRVAFREVLPHGSTVALGYFGARLRELFITATDLAEEAALVYQNPAAGAPPFVKARGGPWVRVAWFHEWPESEKEALRAVLAQHQVLCLEFGIFTGREDKAGLPGLNIRAASSVTSMSLDDLRYANAKSWRDMYRVLTHFDMLAGFLTFDRYAQGKGGDPVKYVLYRGSFE